MKLLLLLLLCLSTATASVSVSDANGGTTCAACSIIVGLAEQLTQIYNESIALSLDRFCNYLPAGGFQEACTLLVSEYGAGIISLIESKETPDVACYGVGLCKHDTPNMCHLFPLPSAPHDQLHSRVQRGIKVAQGARGRPYMEVSKGLCDVPVIAEICHIIDNFGNNHEPVEDLDGDHFSHTDTLRGTSWRGKDCNDLDRNIYPGRRSTTGDGVVDSNCNGIYGIDPSTGSTYEDLWCNGTGQMGVVVLGDSVGAHFHIPPEYLTSRDLSIETFTDLLFTLENEFDWPMLSMTTGHFNSSKWKNSISGPMESIYSTMLKRNRCNHRDYQNIAVNGARSSAMKDTIIKSLARNINSDHPLLVILELVGNDVCNGHHGTDHMTTPQEFHDNYKAIFSHLDSALPKGSVVFVSGLVDGRYLYDSLHNRTHPIGSLRNDVTYAQLYDYLNCLEVSPCFGWMNSNETWRNITYEHAMQLNSVLKDLVSNSSFTNYKLFYHSLDIADLFKMWEAEGGKPWDLIEPVDGFHPNQLANALSANITWKAIETLYSEVIPPVNPHNDFIVKTFGNQDGY